MTTNEEFEWRGCLRTSQSCIIMICRHNISEITFTHIKCQIIKFQHRMLDPIHRISHTDRCWYSLQCEVLETCGIYISTQMKQPLSVNRPWVIHCVHWYRTDNRESGAAHCTCIILYCKQCWPGPGIHVPSTWPSLSPSWTLHTSLCSLYIQVNSQNEVAWPQRCTLDVYNFVI